MRSVLKRAWRDRGFYIRTARFNMPALQSGLWMARDIPIAAGSKNGGMAMERDDAQCSAVTGACMAVRRTVFEELGGLDTAFPVNYNDIDFCLRARRAGYEVIYEPAAVLRHYESGTRPRGTTWHERELFYERWGGVIQQGDPCYSPI